MKSLHYLCLSALLAASSVGVASATTLTLDSYGSASSTIAGASNSATYYTGTLLETGPVLFHVGSTYDIQTGGVWANPTGSSSWVSNNAKNYPGGSNVEPTGAYDYYSTFTDLTPGTSSGTITVLADDTASVYLNGVLITAAASPATTGTCDSSTPNCTLAETYDLSGFIEGTNVLSFSVLQEHGSAEGLDFSGTVNTSVTPEPNSLLLMGTGLFATAALLYRRRATAW